jgi:hypothetical protein
MLASMASRGVSTGTTVGIVIAVLAFFGAAGFYGYVSDKSAAEPFSADAYLGKAITSARGLAADAELISVQADRVTPEGMVDVTQRGGLYLYFRSPSHSGSSQAPKMLGAKGRGSVCPRIRVSASMRRGAKARHFDFETEWDERDSTCGASLPGKVRCSFPQVWEKAIAKGAPHPALADVELETTAGASGPAAVWHFSIVDRGGNGPEKSVFGATFADDCP